MKIKIGNFNFINNKENKLSGYFDFNNKMDYFYLDGMEDTLFISYTINFKDAIDPKFKDYESFDYERDLLKKYNVVDYHKEIRNDVNEFIENIVKEIYSNKSYLRYDLYNDISLEDIKDYEKNSIKSLGNDYESYMDIDNNRIVVDGYIYNPYMRKVENLEELYKDGRFKYEIKAGLIKMEIENNQAPKFVTEYLKVKEFIKDKKTFNLLFNNDEQVKISNDPFYKYKNEISIDISGKKLEDIKAITYGREILEINPEDFKNLTMQIAISPEDKLNLRIDEVKEELDRTFSEYKTELEKNGGYYLTRYMPTNIQGCLNEVIRIDFHNNIIEEAIKDGTYNEKEHGTLKDRPEWYSEKLEVIFERYDLINSLEQAENINELDKIATELGDRKILEIVDELIEKDEESEEDER